MTLQSILLELQSKADEGIKKILLKHGVQEPFFGVKVEDLKIIRKKVKKDYQLSKDLYATGNADAMYLAGLIADEDKMTKEDLSGWAKRATSTNISEYTVPWIAPESRFGYGLALEWIDAKEVFIAACGWSTLASLVAIKPDSALDIPALKKLLARVARDIHQADNRVRQQMNSFIIAMGIYVLPLTDDAIDTAKKIGQVKVDRNGTACKVPEAVAYITKAKESGKLGKKKKMARC